MDKVLRKIEYYHSRFLILLLMILLSSCSHIKRGDGPPNFYVDENKIPDAVPKAERLSKYGNMPYYNVFGKRYYTLKSSKNFEQIGIASWYGTKFHARRTSSGEPYDMLAMTAAHKTLPLPTYLEVTNLRNQRKIIVKVNDRGPFASNRVIDLSYVAAKKLRIIGHGTAYVRLRAIDPYQYARDKMRAHFNTNSQLASDIKSTRPRRTYIDYLSDNLSSTGSAHKSHRHTVLAKAHKKTHFVYLQVGGVFNRKSSAEQLKRRLNTVLSAPIKISNSRKKHAYLVHVGPIKDVATAQRISNKLRHLGIKSTAQ